VRFSAPASRLLSAIAVLGALAAPGAVAGEPAPEPEGPALELNLRETLNKLPFRVHGFWDLRAGTRLQQDRYVSETASIAESRLQLELTKVLDLAGYRPELRLKTDLVGDGVEENLTAELREAYVLMSPLDFADLKIGRQVLTWGTGDLIFINDLFPKNWKAFFIGRDDEYLKHPNDAARLSLFFDAVNIDLVYVPVFDPDVYPDGDRLSYWSGLIRGRAGEGFRVRDDKPDDLIADDEIAIRIYRNLGGYEIALYGYHGYWKSPGGVRPATGVAIFPDLDVLGASVRGRVLAGIGHVEIGYYSSRDDSKGTNPFVNNSEFRALVGYEQEVATDLTAGVQYYIEWMMDYDRYRRTLPAAIHPRDKVRHLVTLRLTQLLLRQNLRLSLFTYYSPSDSDAYLRPKAHYRIDDHWSAEVGANVFLGAHDHTFFGQFERNTNAYAAVRYSF
jgi:hypothetical protein